MERLILTSDRNAQAWGIDLVIASVIFIAGVAIFYFYALNYADESEEKDSLFYDGTIIAESILSEGHPENWNPGNVVKIGIVNEGKINETKLERFYDIASDDYAKTKEIFNTKYDYYFLIDENMTVGAGEITGIGKPGTDLGDIESENLVKITRFSIYKDKPVTVYVYVWN